MAFYVWGDNNNNAGSNNVGGGIGTKTAWFSKSLSEINTTIRQNVPQNHKITKVVMYVNADYDLAGIGQVYIQYGFGGSGSISTYLYGSNGSTKMDSTNPKDYPTSGIDITSYFTNGNGSVVSPFAIRTDNNSHLSVKIWSSNIANKTFFVKNVRLEVTSEVPKYTITWANIDGNGKTTTTTVNRGTVPTYSGTPTKASTAQYTYAFSGWSPSPVAATGNATYTAQFTATLRKYTVTFKDENGTTLKTETVAYGGKPTPPTAPVKPDTAQHKYTFDGWYDSNGNKWTSSTTITAATTFTARYTSTVQKYTIRWFNYDNTLLETDTDVPYGTKPTYNGATPTKPSDDYYNYGFAGWSPSINEGIQGDKNFTAQFAQTDRYYTVRWVNASAEQGVEGALLETDEVKFNTQPDYNGATPKHPKQDTDPALNYDFIGWSAKVTDPAKPDTELEKVKGDITYTAIYETTPKLYAITVILFNSQSTDIYEYGTELTIEAPEIVDFHRFVKWSDGDTRPSRTVQVTGEATYSAEYERIPIPIKANIEQVTGCYMVPDTNTIVYVTNGTVPTVEIGRESVDGWSFLVSNSIPENGYPLKKLFITDNSGVTTRVY